MPATRITRDGRVFITNTAGVERLAGYVDRYDSRGRPARTWRAVLPGGRSRSSFPTRADAAFWLVAA